MENKEKMMAIKKMNKIRDILNDLIILEGDSLKNNICIIMDTENKELLSDLVRTQVTFEESNKFISIYGITIFEQDFKKTLEENGINENQKHIYHNQNARNIFKLYNYNQYAKDIFRLYNYNKAILLFDYNEIYLLDGKKIKKDLQ